MERIAKTHGIPLAVYHDRHSIFQVNLTRPWTLEEELAGRPEPSQFGRLLAELGIEAIPAHSPQAKGRIERLWGTFQDRLVSELRLAGVSTLQEANRFLWAYLARFNTQFAVPAAQPGLAYRPLAAVDPATHFCFKYLRTVAADNVVRFFEHRLQVQPNPERAGYAKARVEVHERLDGSLAVYYQGCQLVFQPAPAEAPVLRARKRKLPPVIITGVDWGAGRTTVIPNLPKEVRAVPTSAPRPDHPWRVYPVVTKSLDSHKPASLSQP